MLVRELRLRWLDGGELMPRDDTATTDETSRVVGLGDTYGTVIVLKFVPEGGDAIRLFAVEKDGRLRLAP